MFLEIRPNDLFSNWFGVSVLFTAAHNISSVLLYASVV
jgi:hypothetical protein